MYATTEHIIYIHVNYRNVCDMAYTYNSCTTSPDLRLFRLYSICIVEYSVVITAVLDGVDTTVHTSQRASVVKGVLLVKLCQYFTS
jgi:hypothetical protein